MLFWQEIATKKDLGKGIDVREGDYTDHSSMVKAFRGVDKLLLASSNNREAIENRTQLAEAAAHVLVTEGHKNKNYTLTNSEAVDFEFVAQHISEILGEEIEYKSPGIHHRWCNLMV